MYNKLQQMKKQQKEPHPRETPPFVQFETVRQCLRISLPEEQLHNLMGLRDMEHINDGRSHQMGFMPYGHPNPKGHKSGDEFKKKKNKMNKKRKDNPDTQRQLQLDMLNSEFTERKPNPKPIPKAKNKCPKQPARPKHKSNQKSIFHDIKYPEIRTKPKELLKLNNFSQCLPPKMEQLEQVYSIHSQRMRNNRSHNLQLREKVHIHRRGHSQLHQQAITKPLKSITINTSKNLKNISQKLAVQLRDNIAEEIFNKSLDSISEYRMRTNFSDELNGMGNRRQNHVIQELYNSSDHSNGEDKRNHDSIDSQDQYLLTMVSQDLKNIRKNLPLAANHKNGKDEEITIKVSNETANAGDTQHESSSTDKRVNNQPKIQFEFIKSEQIQIDHSEPNQAQGSNKLQNTIDSILLQINQLRANQLNNHQGAQNEQSIKSQISSKESENKIDSLLWKSQPSLYELELILQNCLTLDQNQLESGRVKQIARQQKQSNLHKKQGKAIRILDTDDKWKQSKIKRIIKAQKLLKQGYLQVNKILGTSLDTNRQQECSLKKYAQRRLTNTSHSMTHLQKANSRFSHHKLTRQQKPDLKQIQIIELERELKHMPVLNQESEQQYSNQGSIIDGVEGKDKVGVDPFNRLRGNGEKLQEIIQIMIIDFCIEIIEEVEIDFGNPTELFEKLFLSLTKIKAKKRLGFNVGALEIYTFLQKFGRYLQTKRDDQGETYKSIIHNRIQQPIGPKPLQLLKFMRDEPQHKDQEEQSEQAFDQKQTFALSLSWFQQFSQEYIKQYNFGTYYNSDEQRQSKRKLFLKNAMHVHNKAIFDSINQTIDRYRPYGILGEPFPWKKYNKPSPISIKKFNIILNETFEEVSLYSRFLCGIFMEQHVSYKLNELEYLEFKEDRLNKLLCHHINEIEPRWTFIQDEETEMMVEIGRFVLFKLLQEVALEIVEIGDIGSGQSSSEPANRQ